MKSYYGLIICRLDSLGTQIYNSPCNSSPIHYDMRLDVMSDTRTELPVEVFQALRSGFFQAGGTPKIYKIRDKKNTQDDPIDEYIHSILSTKLAPNITTTKSSGPLINPDMVIYRPKSCDFVSRTILVSDSTRIFGFEVKKIERQPSGSVARSSGLDYNTTPPCGTMRVLRGAKVFLITHKTQPRLGGGKAWAGCARRRGAGGGPAPPDRSGG